MSIARRTACISVLVLSLMTVSPFAVAAEDHDFDAEAIGSNLELLGERRDDSRRPGWSKHARPSWVRWRSRRW